MIKENFKHIFETISQSQKYKKGENIYSPGDLVNEIYYIKRGSVKTGCFNETGREITKFVFNNEEVFGELAIVGLKKRRDYAFAIEESEILKINLQPLKVKLRKDIHLTTFFLNVLGERNIGYEERLESMVFKDSKTRILDFLIDSVEKRGKKVGFEYVVNKFYTHHEIANLTTTSRQTVTTILNILKNHNVITFDRRRLLVRDLDKLKAGFC